MSVSQREHVLGPKRKDKAMLFCDFLYSLHKSHQMPLSQLALPLLPEAIWANGRLTSSCASEAIITSFAARCTTLISWIIIAPCLSSDHYVIPSSLLLVVVQSCSNSYKRHILNDELLVVETQLHLGLSWNRIYSFANQWGYTMNYKSYILKRYSRSFSWITVSAWYPNTTMHPYPFYWYQWPGQNMPFLSIGKKLSIITCTFMSTNNLSEQLATQHELRFTLAKSSEETLLLLHSET